VESATAHVDVRKPFSLFSTIVSHGWYQTEPFRWLPREGVLLRAERLHDGRVMTLRVKEAPAKGRVCARLRIEIRGGGARDPGVAAEMARRVGVIVQADADLRPFYQLCRKTPALRSVPRLGAGRCMRAPTLWEDVVKTVLGTNVTWRQAVAMINRLARLGDPAPEGSLRAWPTPGQVLRAGEGFLRDVVRAGYRAPYIVDLAAAQKSGAIDLNALDAASRRLTERELFAKLVALRGVGKSSAHFLMNLLGHYDHVPVDSATFAYATQMLFNGKRPSEQQIRRRFAKFGRWSSLVYWFGRWRPELQWWEAAA
jgi:3-methyladenine DNA glycosylase/8-oxoguanine DNA glycosylase